MYGWVFGANNSVVNNLVWVTNFSIYKAFLQSMSGIKIDLQVVLKSEIACFEKNLPDLSKFNYAFLDGVDPSTGFYL